MNRRVHVAVLRTEYIDAILDGRKTVETRLSRTRREPLHAVRAGDVVYFKQLSGGYRAAARVKRVEFHEDLRPQDVRQLRRRLNDEVLGAPDYWRSKRLARYATLLWLCDVCPASDGPKIDCLYGRAWVSAL